MKKSFLILAMLLLCVASFALSDMVSLNYADGSRTIPVEDVERIYYSATIDSLDIQLADTNYYYKADADLQITFLDSIEGQHKREREALIAIYHALDGDNWYNNDNWCSDKPLSEWYGIFYDNYVLGLGLEYNNLSGYVPQEIANLYYLDWLNLKENPNLSFIHEDFAKLNITSLKLPNVKNLPLASILTMSNLVELYLDLREVEINTEINLENLINLVNLELIVTSAKIPSNINKATKLLNLQLGGFEGNFPDLTGLNDLFSLQIVNGKLSGEIPKELTKLNSISIIKLCNNQLSGTIPPELFLMPNIESIDLSYNSLSGTIPSEMATFLTKIDYYPLGKLKLIYNQLTGPIPDEIEKHPNWYKAWQEIIFHNNFNISQLYLPAPHLRGTDIDGEYIDTDELYSKNSYTILWEIAPGYAYIPLIYWDGYFMKEIYEKYSKYNVDILYHGTSYYPEEVIQIRDSLNLPWHCFFNTQTADSTNRLVISDEKQVVLYYELKPEEHVANTVTVVDSIGRVVFMSDVDGYETELDQFLYRNLCKDSIDYYVSSDYSQHMLIDTLQMATLGKGIDIVLMGDAYSDRQIADSTYNKDLQYLYENLFTEEPYKSYKEMFNVFTVNVVSPTEGYEHGSTALGGFFGYETEVGGNDGAVIEYARRVIPSHKLDNAMIIVAMNSDKYAGTCYMYYPSDTTITFGSGLSISYFPKGGDAETFAQLLHHEALGHGFAKLADEYAYEEYGAVPESTVALHQAQQTNWGWWKNIDFTNDSTEIRWSRLLLDERYQYDGLGAFEGGLTYWTGVWRPTENSIMRYNTGGFNAPSREAIYYRIHKLAYGDEWEYDYEKFVEWDAKNRKTAESPLLIPSRDKMENFTPTHPPVIKQMSWREAVEQKTQQKIKAIPKKGTSATGTTQKGTKIVYTTSK